MTADAPVSAAATIPTVDAPPVLAIEVAGLVKRLGDVTAVNGLELAVPAGTAFALLGPNGAGKTTTIRILATLLRPDAGTARVLGHDLYQEGDAVRARISLTGQLASIDDDLTGFENLVLQSRLQGLSRRDAKRRAGELLEAFRLSDAAGRLVKKYSGGMRRRLDLAASMVVRADLLFLDEPTTGLDPLSRSQIWELVRALVAEGTTVLLTTQYLEEADQLADRIAVMNRGAVIAEGTSGELKASVGPGSLHVRLRDPRRRPEAERLLRRALRTTLHAETDPSALSATVSDPVAVAPALAELTDAGISASEFTFGQPSLDEVFLALTGGRPTDHPVEEDAV